MELVLPEKFEALADALVVAAKKKEEEENKKEAQNKKAEENKKAEPKIAVTALFENRNDMLTALRSLKLADNLQLHTTSLAKANCVPAVFAEEFAVAKKRKACAFVLIGYSQDGVQEWCGALIR